MLMQRILILLGFFMGYVTTRLILLGVQHSRPGDVFMGLIALALWFIFIASYFLNSKNN